MRASGKVMIALALLGSVIISLPSAAEEAVTDRGGISAYTVARLKIFEGSIWVRTPDSGDWEEFLHNSPVAERSRISVPEGSEAELQFHGGQFLLLSEGTEIDILEMRENGTEFRLRYGDIKFYLPESDFAPVRLSVPDRGSIGLPVPGQFWVSAGEGGDSRLVVRSGEATVEAESGRFPVSAGEEASIGRSVRVSRYLGDEGGGYNAPPPLTEEEKRAEIPPAAAYELREYGEWVESSEYGMVWRPRVAPGWTPYYYGRWVWVSPYGWTWIAYEPWGWYPYHYGYWYTDTVFGWVWYPYRSFISFSFVYGDYSYPYYHRHAYYYPARVRYIRDGRNVRWVPLNPGERYGSVRYTRADKRLTRWNRPLQEGSVYVRREGSGGRVWRDVTVVQREQQRNRVSRSDVRRERGGVQGRAARPESVEGSGRGREPSRIERGRVPSVRTESGRSAPAREIRTREIRPGNTGRPPQPGMRNEAPARSRGRSGRSGGGTFSQITRGAEQTVKDNSSGVRTGNPDGTGNHGVVRGESGNRRNADVSGSIRRSGGGGTGRTNGSVRTQGSASGGGPVVRGSEDRNRGVTADRSGRTNAGRANGSVRTQGSASGGGPVVRGSGDRNRGATADRSVRDFRNRSGSREGSPAVRGSGSGLTDLRRTSGRSGGSGRSVGFGRDGGGVRGRR